MVYSGLQTLFAMHTADGMRKNLIMKYHLFELDKIIKERKSLLIKTNPVVEDNHCETKESIQDRLHAYDAYNIFIEPYPVLLFNILCRLILLKLPSYDSLTMRTLTIFPVKLI